MDPNFDFSALYNEFDTLLVGRRAFQTMAQTGNTVIPGMKTFVFSRTLRGSDYPGVTVVAERTEEKLATLRAKRGKDIWLFGGGLFRSLAAAGLVDTVEVRIIPVLLGGGTSLLPAPALRAKLKLTGHTIYKTGVVSLKYALK